MRFTGGCRCGQVQLHVETEKLPPLYACHCFNCQRWSGSAFGLHMLCAAAAVRVTGQPRIYVHEHNGHTSIQYACSICFTRLFNETTAAPNMRVVRAGVLDGIEQLAPIAHIWVKRKQSWVVLPAESAQWQETPTSEEFARILTG